MRRLRTISTRRLYVDRRLARGARRDGGDRPGRARRRRLRCPRRRRSTARPRRAARPRGRGRQRPHRVHQRPAARRLAARHGGASPLAAGAEGRLWLAGDGRFRLELQSDARRRPDRRRRRAPDRLRRRVRRPSTAPSHAAKDERARPATSRTLAGVRRGLDRIAEAWTLSGAQPASTGGQPSYTVRIAPKDDGGLLGAAELAWDAAKRRAAARRRLRAGRRASRCSSSRPPTSRTASCPPPTLRADPPADARVVEIDPPAARREGRAERHVRGLEAVQRRARLPARRAGRAGRAPAPERAARAQRRRRRRAQRLRRGPGRILVFQHRGAGARGRGRAVDRRLPSSRR